MTELSRETGRQLGVMIERSGRITAVIAGDDREIVIPELRPLGKRSLRGMRCVHTHLKNEALSEDDLTDLALLRLDTMAALGVGDDGLPADIYTAHLLPFREDGEAGDGEAGRETGGENRSAYEVSPPLPFHIYQTGSVQTDSGQADFAAFAEALEEEMGRRVTKEVRGAVERAILVSVVKATGAGADKKEQTASVDELRALAETQRVAVIDTLLQRPRKLNPRYLVGTGKIKELIILALQKGATMLIFDQDLSPTQARELGALTELKVIDRSQLILDIFAGRANSRDGKCQVELAQLKYLLPKLTGHGTEMSRLMGGIGGRGPGETKLEADRRKIGKRISHLEKELKLLSRSRRERRRKRAESGIPIISIVGYTNAGKSTLLNAMTNSDTLTEDKLFATLDTATRRMRFPRERDAVITDTVGFIKNLPGDLKRAFRATLEEMEDADLLLHVVDVSDERAELHIKVVNEVLAEIGLDETERLFVFNKADLMDSDAAEDLARVYDGIALSAKDRKTLGPLMRLLAKKLWPEEG